MAPSVISLLCLLVMFMSYTKAQPKLFCMNDKGITRNETMYRTNIETVLSTLTSSGERIGDGFYKSAKGDDCQKVYAIGMCRGDVNKEACHNCLKDYRALMDHCRNQKEAIMWADNCMLHYSNSSISDVMEIEPTLPVLDLEGKNSTDIAQYNQVLGELMDSLSTAASLGSHKKYNAGRRPGPSFETIFGLVQCIPEVLEHECTECLLGAIHNISALCAGHTGCRILRPSCYLRFANWNFYAPDTGITSTKGKSNSIRIAVAVVVPIVAILVISMYIFLRQRNKRRRIDDTIDDTITVTNNDNEVEPSDTMQFNFETIRNATNNFSDSNMLGEGGFGPVYKGILSNGVEVAVKRLSINSGQGDTEFKNEVQLVAKLQHRNLVRLLGFSLHKEEKLLVYEFVPNKSLDYFIFDPIKRASLDWERRYKIIGGIAKGLLYLHEDSRLRIVHRDLKAGNILLDEEMNPKIADFGLARLVAVDESQGNTSRVVGTYGYMAPEYVTEGLFSLKSDVFSFGILVLEIVSGQKNGGYQNREYLISLAWKNWKEGTPINIMDPTLNEGSRNEIMRCIHIALLCVQGNLADRPTMASVVMMLNSFYITLPVPAEPSLLVSNKGSQDTLSWESGTWSVKPR